MNKPKYSFRHCRHRHLTRIGNVLLLMTVHFHIEHHHSSTAVDGSSRVVGSDISIVDDKACHVTHLHKPVAVGLDTAEQHVAQRTFRESDSLYKGLAVFDTDIANANSAEVGSIGGQQGCLLGLSSRQLALLSIASGLVATPLQ